MKTEKRIEETDQTTGEQESSEITKGGGYDDPPEGPFASGKSATAKRKEEDTGPRTR